MLNDLGLLYTGQVVTNNRIAIMTAHCLFMIRLPVHLVNLVGTTHIGQSRL